MAADEDSRPGETGETGESGETAERSGKNVGPHSGTYPARPRDGGVGQENPGCLASLFSLLLLAGIIATIVYGALQLIGGDDPEPEAAASQQASIAPPPPDLPDYIAVRVNEAYDDIDDTAIELVVAEIVEWYRREHGLVAETRSEISIEPECKALFFGEVLGFARRATAPDGSELIEVCVRLDEDRNTAIESQEFKWLVAHEYFHVLQANAGWAFEDVDSLLEGSGECGRFLTEGSAEWFGQMYAWGELQGGGLFDTLESLLSGDTERWYYYEEGARAFDALLHWSAARSAAHFWESDEARCADAFLAEFDVAPGKYESDWRELTSR